MPSKKGAKWIKNPEDSILHWEYYKKLDPTRTQEECEELASKRRKARNKGAIEYYELHFPELSHEEHLRMLNDFRLSYNQNQPTHIEYYQKRYPNLSPEEQKKLHISYLRSTNAECIEFYQQRFPGLSDNEYIKMVEEAKQNKKRTPMAGKKNPGHSSNTSDLERKQRSPKCIEFYEKRYPDLTHEEHIRMMNEHKASVKSILQDKTNQCMCMEHWLSKGLTEEQALEKLQEEYKKRTFTLEKCIEKYGEEKGMKIFEERQIKWQKTLHSKFNSSKIPQSELAKIIINKIRKKFPTTETEFQLSYYSFDAKYKNILIEINGDYWHMNPNMYSFNDKNKVVGKTAGEIWLKDRYKKECAEKRGYKVFIIWESEYNQSPGKVIDKCIKFIHDNVSN